MRAGCAALIAAFAAVLFAAGAAGATRLLRFPDVWRDRIVFSYAGDLWTVGTEGGTARRLTAHAGLELFGKFSPDGQTIAFTGQYGGDEQVYVIPAEGGTPRQLTFYPAQGPLADRWGFDNQVYGWTPDGRSVLFRSGRDGFRLTADARLYTVPANGGPPTALPIPKSGAGHFSPDGRQLVYSPLWRDFRAEKHYAGGWANDVFIVDLGTRALLRVTDDPHTDRDPMWIDDAIYFNSDRTGVFNLYRYDIAARRVTQLTHHNDWDVRWPSGGAGAGAGGQIVYELGGALRLYDTASGVDRAVPIVVPADDTSHRPQPVNAADHIESHAISPGGERLAIVARGDVFSVPVAQGVTRNLTHSSNAHDRDAAWSADGRRLAYVSDRSGEDEIYVQPQDGTGPATALTQGSAARYFAPLWSPDDRRIAFADGAGRLSVIETASRRHTLIVAGGFDLPHDYRWSPDGRYLAYTLIDGTGFAGIYVWSVGDGQSRRVTPPAFQAESPAWAADGDLLYFLGVREFRPLQSEIEFDFATTRDTGIFAVALRPDARNPFAVREEESGVATPGAAGRSRAGIDFDGIEGRVIRVPVEPDNLSNLRAAGETLFYERSDAAYFGREDAKSKVLAYSIGAREADTVAEDVVDWSVTADGRHVLAELDSKEFKLFEVGGKPEDARAVSLAGLETLRIPAEEWREIFDEVWRRYRDYFYVANMHGYDWPKLREKYLPLVAEVGHRADLNYLIAQMISELSVQHAYIEGGDLGLPKRPFVGLPGARFALDAASGRYRIARILAGDNSQELFRSPLTEVGVDVRVGDYVLAIGGRDLTAAVDPYQLLRTTEGQPMEWSVARTPDGAARTVRFMPLATETNLLFLADAAAKRALVDRQSRGRLAYIVLPDMADAGLREFIQWWYPQVRKEGLVVDVRDNGGGEISAMLIERLGRKVGALDYWRNGRWPQTRPNVVQPGPKAALINEETMSDAEVFAHQFHEFGLGPLIGRRTWGGSVGYTDREPLLDGGIVYVPEFGTADAAGHWIIEGRGIDPDIVVEQEPEAVLQGRDPQLERAVAELMQRLTAQPSGLPPPPAPPGRAGER
jgi:tricorn protease